MPDRRSAADPRSRPIIRDSGEQPRAYPDDYGVGPRHQAQPQPSPAADEAAVVDPAGYDDADPAGYDPEAADYQPDGVYAEPFVEHDQPAQAVPVGYTEHGDTVYAHEVGYTPDGEPVYAEEMYTEHGEPVLAEQIIGAPADADHVAGPVYAEDDPVAVLPGHAGGGPPRHRGRRRVEREHHPVLLALGVLLVVIVLIGGILIWWAKDQIDPGGKPGPAVTVVIPPGSSSKDIGKILAREGVIHSATLFPYYVKVQSGGTLYPGKYQMPKNESYGTAVHILEAGPQIVQDRLTIPEGYTLEQIATAIGRLPNVHVSAASFLAATRSGKVTSPFEPAGSHNLEGLVFPATYVVKSTDSAISILQQMVAAFDQNANQAGLTTGAAKLGLTPYQVVVVASMVEKEAKRDQDRGPIASVIYNRLHQNMNLGIDSTLLYGLELTNPNLNPATVDPHTPNPYNTRDNAGLPPTPIANPGLPSLTAAANPPSTDYLYYTVIGPGGQTGFASTNAQFLQLQAQCRAAGYCS